MEDLIICKFGGSSVTSREDIERIEKIIGDDSRRRVVVVSAPGKRNPDDEKVTDLLIELARTKDSEIIKKVLEHYSNLSDDVSDIESELKQRLQTELPEGAYLDNLKALGEQESAKILAKELGWEYVDPRDLLKVSSDFGDAKILRSSRELIRKNLGGLLKDSRRVVVPGFYGYTANGLRATFKRGGSDLTGSFLAASLEVVSYENFTDRDGVFAADPRYVDNPIKLGELTFEELRDLSYSGFNVFQSQAVLPVEIARIPVHIRGSSHYPNGGTYVVVERVIDLEKPVAGIAYKDEFCLFNISMSGLNDIPEVLSAITNTFSKKGISVEHSYTGVDDVSIVLDQNQLKGKSIIGALYNDFEKLIGEDVNIKFEDNIGLLVAAGKGMKRRGELPPRMWLDLLENNIPVWFETQGDQRRCAIYGIDSVNGRRAVNLLYDKYIR